MAARGRGLILDAMPSDPSILGVANQWQGAAIPHAVEQELRSGAVIRAASPPYLLATKLEAFKGRGQRDFLGSRDFADIIALVDGREELVHEIDNSSLEVRYYLAAEVGEILEEARFADAVFGTLRPAGQAKPARRRSCYRACAQSPRAARSRTGPSG